MYVLTADEMRKLDSMTIERVVPSRVLMERAGTAVVMALENELGDLRDHEYVVLVGKGNNGGDGLVVARTLMDYTSNVLVILMSEDLKGDPLENLKAFWEIGGETLTLGKDIDLAELEHILMSHDVIIDALLGIGLKGEVRDPLREIIEMVNISPSYKVCVDVPSGVDSDTGKVMGVAVRCDMTVTFAYPKVGHVLFPGREYTGKLKVASIGIPAVFAEKEGLKRRLITREMVSSLLPDRPRDSNKGTFGRVMIVGGSAIYSGAPVLAALGSMRAGSGLTYILVPEEVHTVGTCNSPELISIPVPSENGFLSERSLDTVKEWVERADVVVLGPGLGLNEKTKRFVEEIVSLEKPMLIDADGLNALAGKVDLLKTRKAPTVITPHPGEFSRLTGKSVSEVKYNYRLAEDFARETGAVVVLKGATTIVTDGEETFFNTTGNPGLAKGGSGDVLSGIIASFMAQGLKPLDAAVLGVYVHGAAADLYRSDMAGLLPSEVAALLPDVLKALRG